MDVRMRRAREDDYPMIWTSTLQTAWDDIPEDERNRTSRPEWEEFTRQRVKPYVEGDRVEAWIAEDDHGTRLGYLLVGNGGGFFTEEPVGYIFDIWIDPASRGQGIGRFLVSWAVDWARRGGYRKIKLSVSEANARAFHLYEAFGFRTERRYMGRTVD